MLRVQIYSLGECLARPAAKAVCALEVEAKVVPRVVVFWKTIHASLVHPGRRRVVANLQAEVAVLCKSGMYLLTSGAELFGEQRP